MAGKVNPLQSYQEATNQLLAINEQRKSSIAQAKMEETLQAAQNNTLAQASEFVATPRQQMTQEANLNPATQNILGQYGLSQPRTQRTSSSTREVTKQNIVINNKNTTITNNNVQVPANTGGPLQSRPVQFQDPGQIKFKTWIANSFSQQNELASKRMREYEKRDSALLRESNKMMRKLKETTSSVASSLNPKNIASSIGNQLKTLLMVFGFAAIAKNWPTLMGWVDKISNGVENIRDNVVGFFNEGGKLTKMLGGKEDENPLQAIKNLFLDKDDGILAYVRKWIDDKLEERNSAIKNVEKPDVSGWDLIKNPGKALGDIVNYLGDILSAIVSPGSVGTKKITATAEEHAKEYQERNADEFWESNKDHKITVGDKSYKISKGDSTLISGEYKGLTPNALDKSGNLTGTAGSTYSQGLEISEAIKESRKGNLQTSTVSVGLGRLQRAADKNGKVALSEEFLVSTIGKEGIKELGLEETNYSYVARKKTQDELDYDNRNRQAGLSTTPTTVAGRVAKRLNPSMQAGTSVGKAINNYLFTEQVPLYTIELREGADPKLSEGEQKLPWAAPKAYTVSKEQLQKIIDKITGIENSVADINDESYMAAVESYLTSKVKDNKKNKIKKDIDVNALFETKRLEEQHNQERAEKWDTSRANSAYETTRDTMRDLGQRVANMWNSKGKKDKANMTVFNFKRVSPSNVDSGDLSGVIEASKTGFFYSGESDANGQGGNGPQSKHKHGYIPLGKDLSGFKHKCTSGPHTFYYEGSGGKISMNGFWWDTGSPKSAKGTNIGRLGFKHVWSGTAEEGWNTEAIEKTGFQLQPGDIMLNFGFGKKGPSSHASMWNGEEWISDTHQGSRAFVYKNGGRLGEESAQIWRYDKNGTRDTKHTRTSEEYEQDGLFDSDDEMFDDATVLPEATITDDLKSSIPSYSNPDLDYGGDYSGYVSYPSLEPTPLGTPQYPSYNFETGTNVMRKSSYTPATSFSTNNTKAEFEKTKKSEVENYTAYLDRVNGNLETLIELMNLDINANAGTMEATNNVVVAVGSLRGSNNKPATPPPSQDYTYMHYQYKEKEV